MSWYYAGGAAAPSYLLSDDMEYINAAAAQAAGWTDSGAVSWAYATSPAPLQGTYSWQSDSTSEYSERAFTASDAIGVYCMFNASSLATVYVLQFWDGTNTNMFLRIRILSTGAIRIYQGDGTVIATSAAGLVTAGITAHLWLYIAKGTGADGVLKVYTSADGTKPGSPDVQTSAGTWTNQWSKITMRSGISSCTLIVDKLRIATTEIGSNPT